MINIRQQLNLTGSYAGGNDACTLKDDNYTLTQYDESVDADHYVTDEWADNYRLTLIDNGVKLYLSLGWDNHCELANGHRQHGEGYLQYNTSIIDNARDAVGLARELADGAYWISDADQLTLYKALLRLISRYLEELADKDNKAMLGY